MAGFTRRSKPLKAGTSIGEIGGVSLAGIADSDLLIYDLATETFLPGKSITGSLTVSGAYNGASLDLSAGAVIDGTLNVGGASTLGGNLTVTGSIAGAALTATSGSFSSTLSVAGATTLAASLSGTSASLSAGLSVGASLAVSGGSSLTSITGTTLGLSGALTVGGASIFTGNGTFQGDLQVVGTISTGGDFAANNISAVNALYGYELTVANTAAFGGAVTMATTLGVTGAVTHSSTTAMVGTATFGAAAGVHQDIDTDETRWYNGATLLGKVGMTTASVWYTHLGDPAENGIVATLNGSVDLYYNNSKTFETISGGAKTTGTHQITGNLDHDGSNVGFYNTAPAAKQTVTGSRGGNAALASLLTALATIGLLTDSSTA